jgi:hypothetical protein
MLYVVAFVVGAIVGGAVVWLFRPTIAADVAVVETDVKKEIGVVETAVDAKTPPIAT